MVEGGGNRIECSETSQSLGYILCNIYIYIFLGNNDNTSLTGLLPGARLREHPMFGDIFPPYVRGHLWVRGRIAASCCIVVGPVVRRAWIKVVAINHYKPFINLIDNSLIIMINQY